MTGNDEHPYLELVKQKKSFNSDEIATFLKHIPKIELHAHLNGCIRESTLLDLARERNVTLSSLLHEIQVECHRSEVAEEGGEQQKKQENTARVNNKRRSLEECFEIFGEIGRCVTDIVALKRIAREALEDFAKHGVAYLELRSTPKILLVNEAESKSEKSTKRGYIETILDVMETFENEEVTRYNLELKNAGSGQIVRLPLVPRYIVSINRAEPLQYAMEHAELAIQLSKEGNKYVVGLDLSGNPLKNDFTNLEPAFQLVRNAGLKTSIHCGELPCDADTTDNDEATADPSPIIDFALKDTEKILAFQPDRLGHALLLTDDMFRTLESSPHRIPIECCPTSNVMTLELATHYQGDLVSGLRMHPRLQKWLDIGYPISLNTDDPGIFNTSASDELILVTEAFKMCDPWKITNIVVDSVSHTFESDDFKNDLRENIMKQVKSFSEGLI